MCERLEGAQPRTSNTAKLSSHMQDPKHAERREGAGRRPPGRREEEDEPMRNTDDNNPKTPVKLPEAALSCLG